MSSSSNRAVVMDTGFANKGRFRLDTIHRLAARLHERGHALLIPQVVTWEWSQHASDDLDEVGRALTKAAGLLDTSLGIELPQPDVPVEQLLKAVHSAVEGVPGAEVVVTSGDGATDAIRQQVLQIGTGIRKGGVKTGAADALVLEAVDDALGVYDQVVLATADRLLAERAEDLGDVVVVSNERLLWEWHGITEPLSDALEEAVVDFLAVTWRESIARGEGTPLLQFGYNVTANLIMDAGFTTQDSRQLDIDIERIDDVVLDEVEAVSGDEVPRLVVATAHVEGQVTITNWFIGPDSDLTDESATVEVQILVPITVELDSNWNPERCVPTDMAEVSPTMADERPAMASHNVRGARRP